MEIKQGDIVLCRFYFSDMKQSKNRPVLVLKDNLPHGDFMAVAISSKIEQLFEDEMLLQTNDFITGTVPKESKIMLRKTFIVSKSVIEKKYGSLTSKSFEKYHQAFCKYFGCTK